MKPWAAPSPQPVPDPLVVVPDEGGQDPEARPLSSPQVGRRLAPFAVTAVVGLALAALSAPRELDRVLLPATTLTVLALAVRLPWRRWPAWTEALPVLGFLLVVAQLRSEFGGASGGFSPLAVLPVIWLALYGTRWQTYTAILGMGLTFVEPLLSGQEQLYQAGEWRRALLWILVGLIIGQTVHSLVGAIRRGERVARQVTARLDGAFSALLDGFLILRAVRDPRGEVVDFVIDYVKIPAQSTRSPEALRGEQVGSFDISLTTGLMPRFLAVHAAGVTEHWHQEFSAPDGSREVYEFQAAPTAEGLSVMFRRVTDEIERRRQLALSSAELRTAFENAPAGMGVVGLDGVCLRANEALAAMLGRPREELVGTRLIALANRRDRSRILGGMRDLEADPSSTSVIDVSVRRPDGTTLHARVRAAVVLDLDGKPSHYLVHLHDHGAQRDHERRLRRERDFTTAVLETTAALVVVLDEQAMVVQFNRAAQEVTGYTVEEVFGRPVWEVLVPPARRDAVRRSFEDVLGRGVPLEHEEDWITKTGQRRRIAWSNAYLTDFEGRRTHVVQTGIDVTTERAAQHLFASVVEAASETAIIGMDLSGTVTVFNPGAQRLLGWEPHELIGRATPMVFHERGEIVAAAREFGVEPGLAVLVDALDNGGRPETRDWTWVRKDGTHRTVSLTVSVMRDTFGQAQGYLAVAEDVTQRRQAETMMLTTLEREREAAEQLREVDRVKTDFVSSVSHELRTPITSVIGYLEMLQDGVAGELLDEQRELLQVVHRNSHRLMSLIEDLLTLSRIESGAFRLEVRDLDVREVVVAAREALEPVLSSRSLDVRFDLGTAPADVEGDAGQLERVVMNLLTNAIKFTEDGGSIAVEVAQEDGEVVLRVIDSGIGIPEAEQSHLFSRFFRSSTARQRAIQGTGLGLSIVQSIVEGHGGRVELLSRHQVGTTVTVVLPRRTPGGSTSAPSGSLVDSVSSGSPAGAPSEGVLR